MNAAELRRCIFFFYHFKQADHRCIAEAMRGEFGHDRIY